MLKFLKKIDTKSIPVVVAIFDGMSVFFICSLLLWLIYLANFTWLVIPLAIFSVIIHLITSVLENKYIINIEKYKATPSHYIFTIIQFFVFWFLIMYLCFNVTLSNFTFSLIVVACIFALIKMLSGIIILPFIMNALKRTKEIGKEYENNKLSFESAIENINKETKITKKQLNICIIFILLPAVLCEITFWWAFYYVIIALNAPIQLKIFAAFVIIFGTILSNFSRILKKELVNKILDIKNYG
jgi:hypothetical protein